MHKAVPAKDERMIIDSSDWSRSCSSDMRKASFSGGIGTDAAEVGVMQRRLGGLVERWPVAFGASKLRLGGSVPSHAKAIDIKESIAHGDFMLSSDFFGVVGE